MGPTDTPDSPKPVIRLPRSIVLVGLMGAGKTSIGKRLAARFGVAFTDADREIEEAAGLSIPDYFDLYGEEAFRSGERRVIARLLDGPPIVLATGGGAFMADDTRAAIREKGISVWLRADLDVLYERVSRRDDRPLLRTEDPKETLRGLMERRYPVYAEADVVIDSHRGPIDGMVDKVRDAVLAHLAAEYGVTA
jgi:shikimate kinase